MNTLKKDSMAGWFSDKKHKLFLTTKTKEDEMNKTMKHWLTLGGVLLCTAMLAGCGGSAKRIEGLQEVKDPFENLQKIVAKITNDGGFAAVGQGTSRREDIAKNKARTDAQAKISQIFKLGVQSLNEDFIEEIGNDDKSEMNEAFTQVARVVTNTVLRGVVLKETKLFKDNKTNQYKAGVVMAIEPGVLKNSLLKEMESAQPRLYERFRASQALKRLDRAVANMDNN